MMLRVILLPQGIDFSQQLEQVERFRPQMEEVGCRHLWVMLLACCSLLARHHPRGLEQTHLMIFVLR